MTDLLADIGGTNARIAFRDRGAPWPRVYFRRSAAFGSALDLLLDVVDAAGARPRRAFIAAPGPVRGDSVALTNLPWTISRAELLDGLSVHRVALLNDLEAVAWSLPHLAGPDLHAWRDGPSDLRGARVVVAPGTGLGVSALAPSASGWTAVASEGGHAKAVMPRPMPGSFAALWDDEPSWEDLLSGPGLLRMFRALDGEAAGPADVTARAAAGEARAQEAVGFFASLLGVCAAEFATIFAARGGVFIAGGVVPALGPLFNTARFIAAFTGRGDLVRDIPLALIAHPTPALVGLAALADVRDRARDSAP